jgi:hypothetical protein
MLPTKAIIPSGRSSVKQPKPVRRLPAWVLANMSLPHFCGVAVELSADSGGLTR